MTAFEYQGTDPRFKKIFNQAMFYRSTITMNKIPETYDASKGLKMVIDVGGGTQALLGMIVAKYPLIRGINFEISAQGLYRSPSTFKQSPSSLYYISSAFLLQFSLKKTKRGFSKIPEPDDTDPSLGRRGKPLRHAAGERARSPFNFSRKLFARLLQFLLGVGFVRLLQWFVALVTLSFFSSFQVACARFKLSSIPEYSIQSSIITNKYL